MADLSIGALARDAGVSVQTLRHYDQLGLLRPTARTKAGYRQYSASDRAKLDVIRTLRELDFDLPTIGRLLGGRTTLGDSASLQLRALEHQARIIRRRMSVLRVFLRTPGALDARRLKQLETLARLERSEQAGFLSQELGRRMGRNAPAGMRETLTRLAMIELPESPTEAQLDAWLELAQLVSDPAFLAHYARRGRAQPASETSATLRQRHAGVLGEALAAKRAGVDPASAKARRIAERWLRALAGQAGRRDVKRFAREMIDAVDSGRHAAEQRFWELMAVLRPDIARSPQMAAGDWLAAAARSWLGIPLAAVAG